MFSIGIIGLPNVGKSTLFNALSQARAAVSNYPFCTIEPNRASVPVPDPRLQRVAEIFAQTEAHPTVIEFVDVAGLVKGASKGEGLGNQFLGHIREADALLHVLRCFPSEAVIHVDGSVDPVRDLEVVNLELAFADLAAVRRRLEKTRTAAKTGDKKTLHQVQVLEEMQRLLERGEKPQVKVDLPDEQEMIREMNLLTLKKTLYSLNVCDEPELCLPHIAPVREYLEARGLPYLEVPSLMEVELQELSPEEAVEMRATMGVQHSALEQVIAASYRLLDLVTFFTAVGKEARAWTLPRGGTALQAAGKIHTDIEKGFVKAEVVSFNALDPAGSYHLAKEKGLVRTEGREYLVQDGDVLRIRFTR